MYFSIKLNLELCMENNNITDVNVRNKSMVKKNIKIFLLFHLDGVFNPSMSICRCLMVAYFVLALGLRRIGP